MDYFNIDPKVKKLPPEKIRFTSLQAEPDADGRRIHIQMEITPFQQSPCIELNLMDDDGNIVSSINIIEPPFNKQELIMHVRNSNQVKGRLNLTACLFYRERDDQDIRSIQFELPDNSKE
jgi:hypothetical protein